MGTLTREATLPFSFCLPSLRGQLLKQQQFAPLRVSELENRFKVLSSHRDLGLKSHMYGIKPAAPGLIAQWDNHYTPLIWYSTLGDSWLSEATVCYWQLAVKGYGSLFSIDNRLEYYCASAAAELMFCWVSIKVLC